MPILYALAVVVAGVVAPPDEGVVYVVVALVAILPLHVLVTSAGDAIPYAVRYRLRLVAGRLGWLTPDEMRPQEPATPPTPGEDGGRAEARDPRKGRGAPCGTGGSAPDRRLDGGALPD